MTEWRDLGYTVRESELIAGYDQDSPTAVEELYIEANRDAYRYEFFEYLKENGNDSFIF